MTSWPLGQAPMTEPSDYRSKIARSRGQTTMWSPGLPIQPGVPPNLLANHFSAIFITNATALSSTALKTRSQTKRMKERAAMAPLRFYFFLSLLGCFCGCSISLAELRKKTYIIHMAKAQMPAAFAEHSRWYDASLRSVSDAAEILYTYDTVAHGFCARLTPAEARALEDIPGVLAVHPEARYELHTTRTPEFLHLDRTEALIPQFNTESDVVVGVVDTGVWPERRSYDDAGLGPVPASWRAGSLYLPRPIPSFTPGTPPMPPIPPTAVSIQAVTRQQNVTCDSKTIYSVSDLNYPSFSVAFETASVAGGGGSSKTTTVKHKRTLTNVGAPGTYKATVSAPAEVSVAVYPLELSFASTGGRKTYTVSFSAASQRSGSTAFGRLVWCDGKHVVASPLAFTWT
ncbi:hypothetical protein ZIOFF_006333 [Zingiber officinale]|uniref:Uncharacterized protein n=1 Tax=Zingiber officinale TaxID=94328 RepID=A0A8J5HVI0_ZINOF|nr:hypothetical protein ZIOFF_006333 [Zingiber officinale]